MKFKLLASALALSAAQPAFAQDTAQLYTGFTLVDPESDTRTADAWLVVRDGKIERVGSGTPPQGEYERHAMPGLYAMPGLIDAHGHITVGPYAVAVVDGAPQVEMRLGDKYTRFNAAIALAFGITSVRNPGGSTETASHYDTMVARGEWVGPEALHAGAIVEPAPFVGEAFAHPKNPREWDAEAARQAHAGMTYFKLYHDLTEDELAEGVRAAKAHGLIPIAHLDDISWTRAAELGVEQFEHALPFSAALLPEEARAGFANDPFARSYYRWFELADFNGPEITQMIEVLRAKNVVIVPTLMVHEVVYNVKDQSAIFPADELKYYQPEAFASAMGNYAALKGVWTDEDAARAHAAWPKALAFVKLLHDSGVKLMIGTDSAGGTPFFPRELGHFVAAGIPAWDVLRMATSGNAALMGLTDTGRIAPGLEADIVFLRADPVADVRNVGTVEATLSNGELYRSAELVALAQDFVE
jgi:imidazolonepropionase-like amidohydrolase